LTLPLEKYLRGEDSDYSKTFINLCEDGRFGYMQLDSSL
jgi:hypothetical protein